MSSDAPPLGAIEAHGLTKRYHVGGRPGLRGLAAPRPGAGEELVALDGIDLSVPPGQSLGIIGPNGSGKSTLLKLLAGVTMPSAGEVTCHGRIGSMIELGLGFHDDLTGIENVRSSAALAGLRRAEVDEILPAVLAFADIGDAVHQRLRQYSTGMRARLGFALATHLPVELLLVDEALAVGDVGFERRCIDRMLELLDGGTTVVFVSHEMWLVDAVSHRVVHLRSGRIVDDGPASDVILRYLSPTLAGVPDASRPAARLTSLEVQPGRIRPWDPIRLEVGVEVDEAVTEPALAVEMSWKSFAPDHPFAHTEAEVAPSLLRSGRRTLEGRTGPVPVTSGHALVRVGLLDAASRESIDVVEGELWIDGGSIARRPNLAAVVHTEVTPTSPGAAPEPSRTAAQASGPVVAATRGVSKRYATSGGRDWGWPGKAPHRQLEGGGAVAVALDDVTLEVHGGLVTGLIGPNGAGKSTFLRVLAGVTAPDEGSVSTKGRVVSMLELGLGFHPDLSGLENLHLSGQLLGLSRGQLAARMPEVLAFADIGDAVRRPVRQLSTGMAARLGLALAVHADADLLLIDETLAVGDQQFQERAVRTLRARCAEGMAAVFVAHDLGLISEVCGRVVRIDRGRVVDDGDPEEVTVRAGGSAASHGTRQMDSRVRVGPLSLSTVHVAPGEPLEVSGVVEVERAAPGVRLEFAYVSNRGASPTELSYDAIVEHLMLHRVVEPAGGSLSNPGWYAHRVVVERSAVHGECVVLVLAYDEVDGRILAMSWQAVTMGTRSVGREVVMDLDATWGELEVGTAAPG